MVSESKTLATMSERERPKMLNIGCGRTHHPAWLNMDLEAMDPNVVEHDITQGIPCPSDSLSAVYHSHILEHLKPEEGIDLLRECYRVLEPGGILRIVVPDLEKIAELYLKMHAQAWAGDRQSQEDYRWIKLELLDQLVRDCSGGRMGRYMATADLKNSQFVRSRVGDEFWVCRSPDSSSPSQHRLGRRLGRLTERWREKFVRCVTRIFLGSDAVLAFDEGLFRSRGEIHRWMYDRFSLRDLCQQIGFDSFEVVTASTSKIEQFGDFELDSKENVVRKPDSLFIECRKNRMTGQANRRVA
ncbi:MAG: methyltransferase domain-containing protein [Mariniblastus sp.]|nr:methyltransferase domain-containing protein [Mariniblastus sp.]